MTRMSDAQCESDRGDEHADQVTIDEAVAAIRRCEFVRYDPVSEGTAWTEQLGRRHNITPVQRSNDGPIQDWATERAIDLALIATQMWWRNEDDGDCLEMLVRGYVWRLPKVHPHRLTLAPRLCMTCARYAHAGKCAPIDDNPNPWSHDE